MCDEGTTAIARQELAGRVMRELGAGVGNLAWATIVIGFVYLAASAMALGLGL